MKKRGLLVIALLVVCALIAVIPLMTIPNSEFGGADGAAEEMITEIAPDYEPWAQSIIEPPGGDVYKRQSIHRPWQAAACLKAAKISVFDNRRPLAAHYQAFA